MKRDDDGPVKAARLALGVRVRERRALSGMTQAEFAEALGVTQPAVSQWESGERQPDYGMYKRIAELLECKIGELLPANQYPSAPLDLAERRAWVDARNTKIRNMGKDE